MELKDGLFYNSTWLSPLRLSWASPTASIKPPPPPSHHSVIEEFGGGGGGRPASGSAHTQDEKWSETKTIGPGLSVGDWQTIV